MGRQNVVVDPARLQFSVNARVLTPIIREGHHDVRTIGTQNRSICHAEPHGQKAKSDKSLVHGEKVDRNWE
jgi:hypothetical protein